MIRLSRFEEVLRFDLARTLAGQGRYWTSAYLVDGILIDSGCAHTAHELTSTLNGHRLLKIINTHSHEDHIGANASIQQQYPHVSLFAHGKALPILANPRQAQPLQPYRRVFWGYPQPSIAQPVSDGDWIEGDTLRFRVVYTPGHTQDHICLYQPDREWLFSGDLFVGGKDRALGAGYNIWEIIHSLKRVSELPLQMLFPGCARVRPNPLAEIRAKIAYLEELGGKVLSLHAQGWEISAITRQLLGQPMWIELITQGHFSRRRLILSYLGNQRPES